MYNIPYLGHELSIVIANIYKIYEDSTGLFFLLEDTHGLISFVAAPISAVTERAE
jgi:hypothetical protein